MQTTTHTPCPSPQMNAKRMITMKEKTYKQTLAYAKAGRRTLRRVLWPNIPPMKASITLHCHHYCIHAMHFPTHCKLETRQKNACPPLPRPGDAPFGESPGPTSGNSFRAVQCCPQCIENQVAKANLRGFSHPANMIRRRKMHKQLRQGQAMRLSLHRPVQRATTWWGQDTSTPDALKTMHFKQTFTYFHTLAT